MTKNHPIFFAEVQSSLRFGVIVHDFAHVSEWLREPEQVGFFALAVAANRLPSLGRIATKYCLCGLDEHEQRSLVITERMKELICNLLDVAQPQEQGWSLRERWQVLGDLVVSCIIFWKNHASFYSADRVFDICDKHSLVWFALVLGDSLGIYQVCKALLIGDYLTQPVDVFNQ